MTIEEAIRIHLLADTDIKTALADVRLFAQAAPQDMTDTHAVYFVVANPVEESHSGNSALAHPTFQIDVWAKKYLDAKALARLIRRRLQGQKGVLGGATGVDVDGINFENAGRDVFDDELKLHGVQQDFTVWHDDP